MVCEEIQKQIILEEQDESSQFDLVEEDTAVTLGGFEKDLDLNEMNFNLIKNSNAFKPKPGFIVEDDIQVGYSSMLDPIRRTEEDKNSWLFNS